MLSGKIHFEFDYYETKIINETESVFLKDFQINIDTNEFLVLDLYDNCKCVKTQNFIKERKIIVYYRDGEIKTYKKNSEDTTLYFDGTEIKKVVINKPKLREDNPHDIRRG
jgi:hypothetical protein